MVKRRAIMGDMGAKRKPPNERRRQPGLACVSTPLRAADDLVAAVDALADRERRSRNTMLVLLLEEALTARGLWPVKAAGEAK